jgi:hypothetical protein
MIWFLTKITIATCYRVCVEAEGSLPDWRGRDRFRGPGVAGRPGGQGRAARWSAIGSARPEGNAGWYLVDLRGKQVSPDDLDGSELADPDDRHPGVVPEDAIRPGVRAI